MVILLTPISQFTPGIRLPSNVRPATGECVHLVTRGHFRSRDKDGGHIIRYAVSENDDPILHANFMALCFIEPGLLPIEVSHFGNRNARPFSFLWPWPWPDDIHIRPWPVSHEDIPDVENEIQGFQKLSYYSLRARAFYYAWSLPVTWQRWR